ncbi:MAG: HtaA domain-containing protein [Corynebacterium sp.]|nr:HtaA domain-containing protein [Corynebacterium sp.]
MSVYTKIGAVGSACALAAGVLATPGISPAAFADSSTITNAAFTWGLNANTSAGAPPAGGSRYFSAGMPPANTKPAEYYKATDGNVSIFQYYADGTTVTPTYETRADYVKKTNPLGRGSQFFTFSNGAGTLNADGSADISWTGTVVVHEYGGLVPYWISNPRLHVNADKSATLTADLGGYSSSMDNPYEKSLLPDYPNQVIANFENVTLSAGTQKTSITPLWDHVEAPIKAGEREQDKSATDWGSWPSDFVAFHNQTNLSSYFYSSAANDASAKRPMALSLAYTTEAGSTVEATPVTKDETQPETKEETETKTETKSESQTPVDSTPAASESFIAKIFTFIFGIPVALFKAIGGVFGSS